MTLLEQLNSMWRISMKKVAFFLIASLGIFLSSCSILVPYHQHYTCKMPPAHGICGSVSKVYTETVKNPKKFGIKE